MNKKMENTKFFYVVKEKDNVATALSHIDPGIGYLGGSIRGKIKVIEKINMGYKIALQDIPKDAYIIKYGQKIAIATVDIKKGACVHIHNTCSMQDLRSNKFDITGKPRDREYKLV